MAKTVVGLMDNAEQAHQVVDELIDCGIDRNDIGLMAQNNPAATDEDYDQSATPESDTTSGALKGAGAGAALGGIAGLALGLSSLAIPGLGPVIAAGPIAAALAGAGVGAVAGGLVGALTHMGVPEEEAHYYAEGVRRGGTLVTVRTENDAMAETAADIMREFGAVDIGQRAGEWRQSGWSGSFDAFTEQSMDIHERAEEPVVANRARVTEEVRVGKETSERRQTVRDTVRRSDVDVQPMGSSMSGIAANQSTYRGPERRVAAA